MDNLTINKHISAQFNAELENAMSQVLSMGGMVEQQLNNAIIAMTTKDQVLAKKIISQDRAINQMEVEINENCIMVIAKRQPTASDLRLLIAIIKTISELERIGDVARKIAKTAFKPLEEQHKPILVSLESLARRGIYMLHGVLDAFARMDLTETVRLYREDEKIDQEYEAVVRQLITYMMEDPRCIPNILAAMSCARSLERVGDRCQNICEFIAYFVKGQDIRYQGEEAMYRLLKENEEEGGND